jgi:3-dehydroquinate synthase
MPIVEVSLGERSYPVVIGPGLLADGVAWRSVIGQHSSIVVVSNEVVAPLYLDRLCHALEGLPVETLVLPDGEQTKSFEIWVRVIDRLVDMQAGRDACLVALGGGVIGDLCGFAAATYMRGVAYIQAPTSLLAQVDAAVGGKTAINHRRGKNLVGAFHQPHAVMADTAALETLPKRHFAAGLAEVVKYGAIRDASFLQWLEQHSVKISERDPDYLDQIVETCVRHKAEVVAADEFEAGQRALLNFGHSFGHALESATGYQQFLHGEAVSIGMIIAATLSEARGLCAHGTAQRLSALLSGFGLPVALPPDLRASLLIEAMALDKKNQGRQTRLVLLEAAGRATVDAQSSEEEIRAAIEQCRGTQARPQGLIHDANQE